MSLMTPAIQEFVRSMSETIEPASPEQIRDLFHGVLSLTALKGRSLGSDVYWRPEGTLVLPDSIRQRANCSMEDSENYYVNFLKTLGSPVVKQTLAVITFTAPSTQSTGYEALQYKITSDESRPLELRCKPVESVIPRLPVNDSWLDQDQWPDPEVILHTPDNLVERISHNVARHDLDMEVSEILGEGIVTATVAEANDLITIVSGYQKN